jgi:hypothetical protein
MSDNDSPSRKLVGALALGIVLLGLLAGGAVAWRATQTEQRAVTGAIAPAQVATASASAPAPAARDHVELPAAPPAAIHGPNAPKPPLPIDTQVVREHPVQPLAPSRVTPPSQTETTETRPSFDIVRIGPQGSAVVAGRATPNADVTLRDNGREIGHAQADPSGQWVVLPDRNLAAGGQELTLASKEPGKPEVTGNAPVVVVVPTREAPATSMAVLTPPDAAPRLLQAPKAEPEPAAKGGGKVGLDVVDYDDHGAVRFAGTGAPGSLVRLYVDNVAVGDAIVDPQGHWGLVPTASVATGDHRLRVDDLGIQGKVIARVELPFQRALLSPDEVLAGHVVVQPRQNLWRLARRAYGQGVRYTVIYEANRDQIRNPNLIYPGQIFAIPPFLDGSAPTGSTGTSASANKSK